MNLPRRGHCCRRSTTRSKISGKRTNAGRRRWKNSAGDRTLARASSVRRNFNSLPTVLRSWFRPIMTGVKRNCGTFVTTRKSGHLHHLHPRSRNSIHRLLQLAPDLSAFALESFRTTVRAPIFVGACESQSFTSPKFSDCLPAQPLPAGERSDFAAPSARQRSHLGWSWYPQVRCRVQPRTNRRHSRRKAC